jgi:D-galactarolactone cycloisomerase
MTDRFTIAAVQAYCYRYPLAVPVVTSFGAMRDRPAVFVRIEDSEGNSGWGEAWCNFPAVGAEHRARIVNEMLAPLLVGRAATPAEVFKSLGARMSVLALQTGEPGPLAQAIAGIDIALWDLAARRARAPLWRMLGGVSPRMRVYASGINPEGCDKTAETMLRRGHRALKLKIGFDAGADRDNLRRLRAMVGEGFLAADVNQGWSLEEALRLAPQLDAFDLAWLEEPLRADQPWRDWHALRRQISMPMAGGENLSGHDAFAVALAEGAIGVVQPDVAKWGGITGCLAVARDTLAAGSIYCPHYLGGGIGLLASAHLLAAAGGDGLLEVDANDNPLRDAFCGAVGDVTDGSIVLTEAAGLGIEPDLAAIASWRTL